MNNNRTLLYIAAGVLVVFLVTRKSAASTPPPAPAQKKKKKGKFGKLFKGIAKGVVGRATGGILGDRYYGGAATMKGQNALNFVAPENVKGGASE